MNKICTLVLLSTLTFGCATTDSDNNEILVDRAKPQLIKRTAPLYPREAAKNGIRGKVKVSYDINENGKPVDINVIESSNPIFNRPAIDSVKQWRYAPKVVNGKPVYVKGYSVALDFGTGR